jgi:hypothetical protein
LLPTLISRIARSYAAVNQVVDYIAPLSWRPVRRLGRPIPRGRRTGGYRGSAGRPRSAADRAPVANDVPAALLAWLRRRSIHCHLRHRHCALGYRRKDSWRALSHAVGRSGARLHPPLLPFGRWRTAISRSNRWRCRRPARSRAPRLALAPHNPQGPVSTAASFEFGFSQPDYIICETVSEDVPWRADVVQEDSRLSF